MARGGARIAAGAWGLRPWRGGTPVPQGGTVHGEVEHQALIQHNLIQNNNQPGGASGSGIYTDQTVCGITAGNACANFLITENAFEGNDNAGVDLSNTDAINAITNVDIGNNTFDMNARAILLFNVDQSTIHNNRITNSTPHNVSGARARLSPPRSQRR